MCMHMSSSRRIFIKVPADSSESQKARNDETSKTLASLEPPIKFGAYQESLYDDVETCYNTSKLSVEMMLDKLLRAHA